MTAGGESEKNSKINLSAPMQNDQDCHHMSLSATVNET